MISSVHSRYRLPTVGDKAWAIPSPGHLLPEGLPDGRRVFILLLDTHCATVGDANGKEWILPYGNIETIQEYFIEEQWLPESDPRALHHVRRMIKEEREQPLLDGVAEFATEWTRRLKWILDRNGATFDRSRRASFEGKWLGGETGAPPKTEPVLRAS